MRRLTVLMFLFLIPCLVTTASGGTNSALPPDQALKLLTEGNARFVSGKRLFPNQTAARRQALTGGQQPFAIVVCCSDSRVPPELVFDRGFGDLFVVRTAGHAVDQAALGSIEYAVDHLGVRLIFVLGHEKCGAVSAVVAGGHAPGHIANIVYAIAPAVKAARRLKGDLVANSVRLHVKSTAAAIWRSGPTIARFTSRNLVRVVGGVYGLAGGKVTLVP